MCLNLAERFHHSLEEMLKNAPEVESEEVGSQVEIVASEAGYVSTPGECCSFINL